MLRVPFVLAAAAVVALGLPPAETIAQSPAAVRIAVLGATDSSSEPIYADAAGIFKRNGIDAQIQEFTGGGAIVAAVAGGAVDVGETNTVSAAAAIGRGLPIIVLAPAALYDQNEPDMLLVKARGSKLRTAADLTGKTVAVTTLRGELQTGAQAWIEKSGGDVKAVKFVEMPSSAMAAALKQGRIDAAMLPEPQLTAAKADVEKLADPFAAIAPQFDISVFVATKAWASAHPGAAQRFVQSMVEAAHWSNAHHAETAAILAKRSKLDPEILRTMGRSAYGDQLSAARLQPPIDAAFRFGNLKTRVSAAAMVADSAPYWKAVRR